MMKQLLLNEIEKPTFGNESFDLFLKGVWDCSDSFSDNDIRSQVVDMFYCGRKPVWLNNGSYNLEVMQSCDNRFCPVCSKRRAVKYNDTLRKYFKRLQKESLAQYMRFVTLTYQNVTAEQLPDTLSKISHDLVIFFKKLKSFGYGVTGGYRVLEITTSKSLDGFSLFHPHIHLLYFAKVEDDEKVRKRFSKFVSAFNVRTIKGDLATYNSSFYINGYADGFIESKVLNYVWRESNHLKSFVTKPVAFNYKKIGSGINYICKYMTKGFYDGSTSSSDLLVLYQATRKLRYFQKFGSDFRQFKFSDFGKVSLYYETDVYQTPDGLKPFSHAQKFTFGFWGDLDFTTKDHVVFIETS